MAQMTQEILEDTEKEIKKWIKELEINCRKRAKIILFYGFPVYRLNVKVERNLKTLLRLVKRLEIIEVNEEYDIIYRGKEINSIQTYKRCSEAYATILNNKGIASKEIFYECKTLVNALIQALPLIIAEEE